MLNQEHKSLTHWVLAQAKTLGCQECKVSISMGYENLIEIRDGQVDQINHAASCLLIIHLYVDGRHSLVSTNRLDKEELTLFIANSISNTRHLAPDPYRYLPDATLYYKAENNIDLLNYDYAYTQVSMDEKLAIAHAAYAEMGAHKDKIISGTAMVDDYEGSSYIITSNGFEAEKLGTSFAISCTTSVQGEGDERPEGSWYDYSPFWISLPKAGIGIESTRRAIKKIGSKKIKEGEYNMIVENMVSNRLLSPIISALSGEAIQQQRSFLIDKKGISLFSPILTLIDNPLEIGNAGAQLFDSDGIILKERTIIENGKINEYYINQYISRKLECEATTGSPSVLKLPKGELSLQDLISKQDKAIFVTGFNGGNCNGTSGDFSYGIEGFLIENGVLTTPFSEMLITGNMLNLWLSLSNIADDAREQSSWQIPSLLFENILIS